MAAVEEQPASPVLANLVVIAGFVAVFSTFATDEAASWILGVVLILAGGIWAGFAGGSGVMSQMVVSEASVGDVSGADDSPEGAVGEKTDGGAS